MTVPLLANLMFLADAGDVIGAIVLIVMMLLGLLAKLVEQASKRPPAQRPPAQRPPVQPRGPVPPGGQPRQPGEPFVLSDREMREAELPSQAPMGEAEQPLILTASDERRSVGELPVEAEAAPESPHSEVSSLDAMHEPVSPVAAELVGMLRSPSGIRQAILLSEILQRPEHRWER